jgi:hypothetical protein
VVLVNCLVFVVLFAAVEFSYRIYRDGFTKTVANLGSDRVPYSNLGVSNWVIFDDDLGYRLNRGGDTTNPFPIHHGEITIPKPEKDYRILYLGDSIPWDKHGFAEQSKVLLSDKGRYDVINAAVPGYTSYQEVLLYEKYLKPITPDLVIWTYCLNDNHRFLHRFDEKAKML